MKTTPTNRGLDYQKPLFPFLKTVVFDSLKKFESK